SMQIVDDLKDRARKLHDVDIVEVTKEHIKAILPPVMPPLLTFPDKPKVLLVVGVNGTGKTTSTAKLAHLLQKRGHSVVLAAPHEVLLVVDATTGGNALQQAREFHKAVPLTGLIVTKLDGSGKGGILVAIHQELGIPARFVGTGERMEDFAAFDARTYLDQLL